MEPDLMQIETTSICNLRCVFCPYPNMTRPKQFMPIERFRAFVDSQCGHIASVGLHHFGEPFLDRSLHEFVAVCTERGIDTTISTNASQIHAEAAAAVLSAGVGRIIVSLDAVRAETYERLRLRGVFSETLASIERLLEAKLMLTAKTFIQMQFIITPENVDEAEIFRHTWTKKPGVNQVVLRDERSHGGQVVRHTAYAERKTPRLPCRYLWESLVVLVDGRATICCKDFDGKETLGNVFEGDDLVTLWNGGRMRELRQRHLEGNLTGTLCSDCNEWCGHSAMSELESISSFAAFRLIKARSRTRISHRRDFE